ncbi:MAG: ABC transporter ATP-binding protein [Patescibacteria group bacterium]|nr:ABC transporter ATP-binding protein [Patescibacteria group bacterium]
METLISIKDLTKDYELEGGVANILRGVSFSISSGELVAIMGPSGSGKSTLMHILGFLDRPTSGTYLFRGRDIKTLSDDELARLRNKEIGFVFQSFNLLKRTSVLDNVKLPLSYVGYKVTDGDERAKKGLDAVGLSHRLHNRPNQLSGGEQQRVAIARALINNPSIIFADEPTGNLDSKSGAQVMQLFKDLHHQGHTIVLVTHDATVAHQAHRILHVMDGQIVQDEKISGG